MKNDKNLREIEKRLEKRIQGTGAWIAKLSLIIGMLLIGIALSAQQPLLEIDMKAYPNPTEGRFVVQTADDQIIQSVSVYDLNGILVIEQVSQRSKYELDVGHLAEGLYILRVLTEKGIATQYFQKVN